MYITTSCSLIITPIRKHTDKLNPPDPEQKNVNERCDR